MIGTIVKVKVRCDAIPKSWLVEHKTPPTISPEHEGRKSYLIVVFKTPRPTEASCELGVLKTKISSAFVFVSGGAVRTPTRTERRYSGRSIVIPVPVGSFRANPHQSRIVNQPTGKLLTR